MTHTHKLAAALLVSAAVSVTTVRADASELPGATPAMERALAKAQEGPDELRRFVARTAPIYMLDWNQIARHLEARRQAREAAETTVASQGLPTRAEGRVPR
jgi:hypothetical protein